MAVLALFDLDNTLSDRTGAFARWSEAFCTDNGLPRSELGWLREVDEDGFLDREPFFEKVRSRFGIRQTFAFQSGSARIWALLGNAGVNVSMDKSWAALKP